MLGFKLRTIPHAFVVGRDGAFLWHGDPLHGLNELLSDVLAGKYQIARAREIDAYRVQVESYERMAERGDPRARAAGEMLIQGWTNNVNYLCDFAYTIITDTRNRGRDLTLAGEALDLAETLAPTNTLRLFVTRAAYLCETGKPDEAVAMTKQAIAEAKDPKEKAAFAPYLRAMERRQKERQALKNTGSVTITNFVTITNIVTQTNFVTVTNSPDATSGK
jgi:hypothetical protein